MAPNLTIVIPSYQRRDQLSRLLDSIADAVAALPTAEQRALVDVVVVLDGSTDGSLEAIGRRADPMDVDVCWQPNAGQAVARNSGVDRARGALVWLLDDDMVVSRTALEHHLTAAREDAPVVVGPCSIVSADPDALHAGAFYRDRHDRLVRVGRIDAAHDCSFANTSAPTALLRAHRFDGSFRGYGVEDYELAMRMLDAGVVIRFDPLAAVDHDWASLGPNRRHKLREEGRNRIRFVELHPDRVAIVFRQSPGRLERVLRRLARPDADRLLFALAVLLGWSSNAMPVRGVRNRLATWADLCAVYSGVASSGGWSRTGLSSA